MGAGGSQMPMANKLMNGSKGVKVLCVLLGLAGGWGLKGLRHGEQLAAAGQDRQALHSTDEKFEDALRRIEDKLDRALAALPRTP